MTFQTNTKQLIPWNCPRKFTNDRTNKYWTMPTGTYVILCISDKLPFARTLQNVR